MSELERQLRAIDARHKSDMDLGGLEPPGVDDHAWLTSRPGFNKSHMTIAVLGLVVVSWAAYQMSKQAHQAVDTQSTAALAPSEENQKTVGDGLSPADSHSTRDQVAPSPASPVHSTLPFHEEALALWRGGMRQEAADIWRNSLNRIVPSTQMIRVGTEHETQAAEDILSDWNTAVPMLVTSAPDTGKERWIILALPAPVEFDRHFQSLQSAFGDVVTWTKVSDFVQDLQAIRTEPQSQASSTHTTAVGFAPKPGTTNETTSRQTPADTTTPSTPPRTAELSDAINRRSIPAAAPTPTAIAGLSNSQAPARQPSTDGESTTAERSLSAQPSENALPPELRRYEPGVVPVERGSASAHAIERDFQSVEAMLAAHQYSEALSKLRQLEGTVGSNWRTQYLKGAALSGLGRWQEAKDSLASAWKANPTHLRVPLYLAVAQQELGKHQEALTTLQSALEVHPESPDLWLNQGHSLQALGRASEAQLSYWRFMDFSGRRPDLLPQRAWVQNLFTRIKQ